MNPTPEVKWKQFIPWLKSQPRDRRFVYSSNRECMVCAFLKEVCGIEGPYVEPQYWHLSSFSLCGGQLIPQEIANALIMEADKDRRSRGRRSRGYIAEITVGNVLALLEKEE